jgi:hypothetical protein
VEHVVAANLIGTVGWSLADISRSFAELAAPQETTTMLPVNSIGFPSCVA